MKDQQLIIEEGIVAGNAYDKYGTKNPVARAMMNGFLNNFQRLVRNVGAREVHEVGCGEGHLGILLAKEGLNVRGSDFSSQIIAQARRNIQPTGLEIRLEIASIYDLSPVKDSAELIVCCEVLEHLEEPERALDVLAALAKPHLIVSVPREPIWRVLNMARGKYWAQGGNTPGHLNHWSRASFLRFLQRRLEIVECCSPFPWTMVRCRVR